MPEVDLYLSLAEIAGVFVGFGALIAVRSGGVTEAWEIAPVRAVLITGMGTIIAALAPVTLGRYDLTEHQVLALSSVAVLVSYVGLMFIHVRAPEYRASAAVLATVPSRRWVAVVETVAYVLVVGGPLVALVVIALGLAPSLEAALYFTVVVLFLAQGAWTLLWIAFIDRRSAAGQESPPPGSSGPDRAIEEP